MKQVVAFLIANILKGAWPLTVYPLVVIYGDCTEHYVYKVMYVATLMIISFRLGVLERRDKGIAGVLLLLVPMSVVLFIESSVNAQLDAYFVVCILLNFVSLLLGRYVRQHTKKHQIYDNMRPSIQIMVLSAFFLFAFYVCFTSNDLKVKIVAYFQHNKMDLSTEIQPRDINVLNKAITFYLHDQGSSSLEGGQVKMILRSESLDLNCFTSSELCRFYPVEVAVAMSLRNTETVSISGLQLEDQNIYMVNDFEKIKTYESLLNFFDKYPDFTDSDYITTSLPGYNLDGKEAGVILEVGPEVDIGGSCVHLLLEKESNEWRVKRNLETGIPICSRPN